MASGFLIGLAPEDVYERLARRAGLNLQRILLGESPESLTLFISPVERPCINMATARRVGVSPDVSVLVETELIQDAARDSGQVLSLSQAVREALDRSPDLAALARGVVAGEALVSRARAPLLPQVEVAGRGAVIDADRAEASLGALRERTLTGSATVTQVLFSDAAWAGYRIQRYVQSGREEEYGQNRLDLIVQTAAAYLNLLRAGSFERIQISNLRGTLSNLDLARIRRNVGAARPAEVFRWESQAATNRRDLARVYAQRSIAAMELNRLLARPLEQPVRTAETDLNDPVTMGSRQRLFSCLGNLEAFRVLRDFMAEEGLRGAPEVRRLDAGIAAQERFQAATRRKFYLPTVAAQGQLGNTFKKSGAGAGGLRLPPTIPFTLPRANDRNWSVGLNVSYPLFAGGEHLAEAARKNLELVTEAYSQGVASIIDLLDAQNLAVTAEQGAASAVYNFLLDWLGVERSVGAFDFLRGEEERGAFYGRFEAFFKRAGVSPSGR